MMISSSPASSAVVVVPPGAVWDPVRLLWTVNGQPLDPQPAPLGSGGAGGGLTSRSPFTDRAVAVDPSLPPSLRVEV